MALVLVHPHSSEDRSARSVEVRDAGAAAAGRVEVDVDDALVERACRGDRAAEEAIYRRHVRYIAGMVTRLLGGHRQEYEDVVQDTFALALDQLATLRDRGALRAWLAQIAVSQVRRRCRRHRLLRLFGLDGAREEAALDTIASNDASPETRAALAALSRVLSTLPADQRIAWCLRFVEGEKLEDVAHVCGCSLATAKRRIAAADDHVRACVPLPEGWT